MILPCIHANKETIIKELINKAEVSLITKMLHINNHTEISKEQSYLIEAIVDIISERSTEADFIGNILQTIDNIWVLDALSSLLPIITEETKICIDQLIESASSAQKVEILVLSRQKGLADIKNTVLSSIRDEWLTKISHQQNHTMYDDHRYYLCVADLLEDLVSEDTTGQNIRDLYNIRLTAYQTAFTIMSAQEKALYPHIVQTIDGLTISLESIDPYNWDGDHRIDPAMHNINYFDFIEADIAGAIVHM